MTWKIVLASKSQFVAKFEIIIAKPDIDGIGHNTIHSTIHIVSCSMHPVILTPSPLEGLDWNSVVSRDEYVRHRFDIRLRQTISWSHISLFFFVGLVPSVHFSAQHATASMESVS